MKTIRVLHAHNHGHQNVGDDAMANNVYRKLVARFDDVWTITTYTPPSGANNDRDVKSLSAIINNYGNMCVKFALVLMSKLKLKLFYAVYAYTFCEIVYRIAWLRKKGFPTLAFGKVKKTIHALSECESYVRSGSGSLNDIWFWSSMYPQYTEARIAHLFGSKVYFLGQGIGPLTTEYRIKVLGRLSRVCSLITLRDPINSSLLLAQASQGRDNWIAVGDDALDHPVEQVPDIVNDVFIKKKYVLCQFRTTDYEKSLQKNYWKSLAIHLQEISTKYPDLDLIAISFSTGRVNDILAAKEINKALDTPILKIVDHGFTPGQAKALFSGAQFSIGQSYHFGVFSLAENTPFIGIYSNEYYKNKLCGLLEWYNYAFCAISSDKFETMMSVADRIIENSNSMQQCIRSVNESQTTKINSVFDQI